MPAYLPPSEFPLHIPDAQQVDRTSGHHQQAMFLQAQHPEYRRSEMHSLLFYAHNIPRWIYPNPHHHNDVASKSLTSHDTIPNGDKLRIKHHANSREGTDRRHSLPQRSHFPTTGQIVTVPEVTPRRQVHVDRRVESDTSVTGATMEWSSSQR